LMASMAIAIAPSLDGAGPGVDLLPCRLELLRPLWAAAAEASFGGELPAAVGFAAVDPACSCGGAATVAAGTGDPPMDMAACAPAESGGADATAATAS